MAYKIPVGILGATGAVGQKYLSLLTDHPWFEVTYVAASKQSAGKQLGAALEGRLSPDNHISRSTLNLMVYDADNINETTAKCRFVFSAVETSKDETRRLEQNYAQMGIPVVSNASAHRWDEDIPMIIPEINPGHLDIIPVQQKNRGWDKGYIVVKPNCSIQSFLTPVYAIIRAGYRISDIAVTTMQAVSGAGTIGVPSMRIIDNVIPYIPGEEEKTETEPLKILGELENGRIVNYSGLSISAHCNRVPVLDGHMACVSLMFKCVPPSLEKILAIWNEFKSTLEEPKLPSAPEFPIVYMPDVDRPQPRFDRNLGNGMAVSVGRLRSDKPNSAFDYKFVGLSHNTIRGAAGGAILTAELLKARGYL